MPERANQHARAAKKRKAKDNLLLIKDGYDSSEGLQAKQRGDHPMANGNGLQEIKQPEALKAPSSYQAEDFYSKYPINNGLTEHMESIMNELKEAREKLLQWMRQEIQAISTSSHISQKETGKQKHQVEYSSNAESVGAQAPRQGVVACEAAKLEDRQDHMRKFEAGPAADAREVHVHDNRVSSGILQNKNSGLMPVEPKPKIVDMPINSGLGSTSKTVNGLDQGLPNNVSSKDQMGISKAGNPTQDTMTKMPTESRNALFDMCFGAGLADDVKDVEGLDGTLESSVTIRDGFEFNKANHDIQKGLDGLERLRETKSALLDMGFEDDESNEGTGVGCSLESAASSKVNSGFSRASKGIQRGFSRGNDIGFATRFGEKSKEHTPASSADVYRPSKVKKESTSTVGAETNHFVVNKRLDTGIRGDKREDESKQADHPMGTNLTQASLNGSGFPSQNSQPGEHQQTGLNARSGCGIKRSYGSAMTFKGSALENKNDALKACQENPSFADVFNSGPSSILVMKNSTQPSAPDRGKIEPLAVQNEGGNSLGIPGSAPAWNMFTASKNPIQHTLQDSKVAHLEYASRSKLGDAILGSGTTLNFQGFDPVFGYSPQYKASSEMMDAYQQERVHANSMYFSTLCTNNSDYLSASNRGVGMQRPLPTASPSSASSALRPMLMGMPGHVGGHHDPSNMHTFLGLGMNGVPAAANGMQLLPGLYLQSNQPHTQASFKHAPSSTSPMVPHQESSAAQEKAVLELNF